MEEFFVIDSLNYNSISDSLIGFVVSTNGIFDCSNSEALTEDDITGNGAYILIRCHKDYISVRQDYNGSWGLYYYSNGDYFAISNSVLMLIDHLKNKKRLSINIDYANNLLTNSLCSRAVSETIINEIQLVERNKEIIIRKTGNVELRKIDYKENTVALDSCEGIAILDAWHDKWVSIITKLGESNSQISADLSGGLDSRMTLAVMNGAKIDWNRINVNSYKDNLHTHGEDYEIAMQIADHFGFRLNEQQFSEDAYYYDVEELLKKSFFTKLTVHKEFFFSDKVYKIKRYKVTGDGGEAFRAKWNSNRQNFINAECSMADKYSQGLAEELRQSNADILDRGYKYVKDNYSVDCDSVDGTLALYKDTWNRSHFGKNAVESYYGNVYRLQPLIDPDLYRLTASSPSCEDRNLLMAMIFVRYCPELLNFKIQGNRHIDSNTVDYARFISDKYKRTTKKDDSSFNIIQEDTRLLALEPYQFNRCKDASKIVRDFLSMICHQPNGKLKKVFCSAFSKEFIDYAIEHMENNRYVPLRQFYAILGIAWTMAEINHVFNSDFKSLYEGLQYFNCDVLSEIEFPYDKVEKGARIVLYGAGNKGIIFKKQIDDSKCCEIVKWVDKRYLQIGQGVEDISQIKEADYDYIVLAIFNKEELKSAVNNLLTMGVDEKAIVY